MYALYALSVFTGAFLLFVTQPMAAKALLPLFGGTSSVWAASLVFFTGALCIGYAYVYLIARATVRTQVVLHMVLLAAGVCAVGGVQFFGEGFRAVYASVVAGGSGGSLTLILALTAGLGLPYAVLASTGPLLQHWYGTARQREPYRLYAISNGGSLAALAAYPLGIEPFIRLLEQEILWAVLFCTYAICIALCAIAFYLHGEKMPETRGESPGLRRYLAWFSLAALPALMLAATTTQITQVIAPVPLLWIIPLAAYLMSFIAAFMGLRPRAWIAVSVLATIGGAYALMGRDWYGAFGMVAAIGIHVALLFFVSLYAHALLYERRPSLSRLPLFYLVIALGGAVGTFFVGVIAPFVFPDYWEFPLGLLACGLLALGTLAHRVPWMRGRIRHRSVLISFGGLIATVVLIQHLLAGLGNYDLAYRNFYGTIKVRVTEMSRELYHGTTLHGFQYRKSAWEFLPPVYYSPETGLGRSFMYARTLRPDHTLSAGIVGLGAGIMAAYCVEGDSFEFFEIDPSMEPIAREYFTMLARCPQATVRTGDGRLLLQENTGAEESRYDILIIDAFADDTIPVHLLTREAFSIYASRLHPESGILAVHISNRYLDLLPVVMGHARSLGLSFIYAESQFGQNALTAPARWVLLSPNEAAFSEDIFAHAASSFTTREVRDWTDDFSDIVSVVRLRWR